MLDFTVQELTNAINVIPNMFGRIKELDIFRTVGITTKIVTVEQKDGVLNLLPSKSRTGDDTNVNKRPDRKLLTFETPHIPLNDLILAEDIQDVREFGTQNVAMTAASAVAESLAEMRNKHAITLEFLRSGALQGKIFDADGVTVLGDFHTEFGNTPKIVDFDFTTGGFKPSVKVREIVRHIELALQGEVMSEIRVFVSPEWWDDFIVNDEVKEAYKFFRDNMGRNVGAEDVRRGFEFHGIVFEEYLGSGSFLEEDGTSTIRNFVTADEAYAFPLGTRDTFWTFWAPGNLIEAANTLGLEMYAFQESRIDHKGWDLHTEMNPFPICKRPNLLVRITKS